MSSKLRSVLQKGSLVAALVIGAGTALTRELDSRAAREARAAMIVASRTDPRTALQPEAAAALRMAQGSRTVASLAAVSGSLHTSDVSVATAGQALLLGLSGAEPAPNAAIVARVRSGAPIEASAWSTTGLAGLVALEAGRAGRLDLLSALVFTAAEGPSVPDRLAARSALARLGYDGEGHPKAEAQPTQVVQ